MIIDWNVFFDQFLTHGKLYGAEAEKIILNLSFILDLVPALTEVIFVNIFSLS